MRNGLFISIFLILLSCSRPNVFGEIEPNTNRVVVEFKDARTGTTVSHSYSADPIEIDLTEIRLNPRTVTDHDTKVKVILNSVVVYDYNTANGTSYKPVPATAIALPTANYVLGPEKRSTMVRCVVRPSSLLNGFYAIGLSIAEMSDGDISPIGKNVIVFISIKNEYDGIYRLNGFSQIPGSAYIGNFTVPCTEKLEVATASDNSVHLSPAQPVANGSSFIYISNLLPTIQFDKATNKVSGVIGRAGGIDLIFPYDPNYNSRYDASTKTIFVKYGIAPAGSGRFIIDTLTYCGPR